MSVQHALYHHEQVVLAICPNMQWLHDAGHARRSIILLHDALCKENGGLEQAHMWQCHVSTSIQPNLAPRLSYMVNKI